MNNIERETLIEYVNMHPNNWILGAEIRKKMPNDELVIKFPNDGDLGREFRKKINLINNLVD